MTAAWSEFEVEAVVADYFDMMLKELRGEEFSKTAHRRALARLLDDRSDGSVEFKHQNISAVLISMGYPYIEGYKPRRNYQHLLANAVIARITNDREIEPVVGAAVEALAESADTTDILARHALPPRLGRSRVSQTNLDFGPTIVPRAKVNYLEREARNRSLGLMGENFALAFEKARLQQAGCGRLARQVEHVSVTQGDGLGFDLLSFETDGSDRLIEVKTTAFGIDTPFFVSRNEVRVSELRDAAYHLYRVFAYRTNPRMYVLAGDLNRVCRLSPVQYVASPA